MGECENNTTSDAGMNEQENINECFLDDDKDLLRDVVDAFSIRNSQFLLVNLAAKSHPIVSSPMR